MPQRGFAPILIVLLIGIALVVAGGAYYFGLDHGFEKSVSQTPQVSSPTPTVSESTSSADMSNWKTFKNLAFNYQIEYPDSYVGADQFSQTESQLKSGSKVCFVIDSRCSVSVDVYNNPTNLSLESWVDKNQIPLQSYGGIIKATTKEVLNGFDALYARNETEIVYYLKYKSFIYRVHGSVNQKHGQVISTFKIIDTF